MEICFLHLSLHTNEVLIKYATRPYVLSSLGGVPTLPLEVTMGFLSRKASACGCRLAVLVVTITVATKAQNKVV